MEEIKDWLLNQKYGSVGPTVGSEVVVNGSGSGPTSTPSYVANAEEIKSTAAGVANDVYEAAVGSANENYASYAEFLTGNKNTAYGNAEQIRAEAEKVAETNRQRGVIDAQASYDFNKATYGQNAEALRSMGLTGSGYADYLTSRAYATQRAEVQGANAQAAAAKREAADAEAKAKLAADATYNEGLFQATITRDNNIAAADAALNSTLADIEESYQSNILSGKDKADATFATLLDSANTGNYTAEALAEIARNAGCTDEQISLIGEAVSAANTKKNAKAYADYFELAKSGDHTIDELNALMNNTNLTYNQKESIISAATDVAKGEKSAVQEANYQTFYSLMGTDEFDISEVTRAHLNGKLSTPQLNSLQAKYNEIFNISADSFVKKDGSAMSRSEAQADLNEILSDKWLSQENKYAAQAAFDKKYTAKTIESFGVHYSLNEGNWVTLVDTSNDKKYKAKTVDIVTSSEVLSAASGLSYGTIFALDGKLYYVGGGRNNRKIWSLGQWGNDTGYDRLEKVFGITG